MRCKYPQNSQLQNGYTIMRCGLCAACRSTRQASWIARLLLEQYEIGFGNFVTLTYDQEHVTQQLEYQHIQAFLKRLRKNTHWKIRFFCVGEYGSKTGRPHWHLLTFQKENLWTASPIVTAAWRAGFIQISPTPLSTKEIGYCLKYMWKEELSLARMSRNPGLGLRPLYDRGVFAGKQYRAVSLPLSVNIDGRRYPLDRSMRQAFETGVAQSGGRVYKHSNAAHDLKTRVLFIKKGGPDFAYT